MKQIASTWFISLALLGGGCGGANADRGAPAAHDPGASPSTIDVGPGVPGAMPSDGTQAGSSSSGGPSTGTIPPAESPNAPPSGIAH